jgi:hypothetical protein
MSFRIEFEGLIKGGNSTEAFKDVHDIFLNHFSPIQITSITKLLDCAQKKSEGSAPELSIKEKLRNELQSCVQSLEGTMQDQEKSLLHETGNHKALEEKRVVLQLIVSGLPAVGKESAAVGDGDLSRDSKNSASTKKLQSVQLHYEFQEYHLQRDVEKIIELKNEHKLISE